MKIRKLLYKAVTSLGLMKMINLFNVDLYRVLINALLKWVGVTMTGKVRYIAPDCYLDGVNYGNITLSNNVVISAKVVILTHDYSITCVLRSAGHKIVTDVRVERPVVIKEIAFVGLGAILLPGAVIGKNVIVGAGSVVRGVIPDNTVICGNPARVIMKTSGYYKKVVRRYNAERFIHDES